MRVTKLIAAVIGVPMIIGSFALAVGGGIALAVQDDGWVETGPIRIETDSAALVANDIEVDFGRSITKGRTFISWGEIPARLDLSERGSESVFVGIAAQNDVDAYLAGVARDEVTSLHHDDYDLVHRRGEYQATPPAESDIWVATSEGGVLEWDLRDGEWAIVALNQDGSPVCESRPNGRMTVRSSKIRTIR